MGYMYKTLPFPVRKGERDMYERSIEGTYNIYHKEETFITDFINHCLSMEDLNKDVFIYENNLDIYLSSLEDIDKNIDLNKIVIINPNYLAHILIDIKNNILPDKVDFNSEKYYDDIKPATITEVYAMMSVNALRIPVVMYGFDSRIFAEILLQMNLSEDSNKEYNKTIYNYDEF